MLRVSRGTRGGRATGTPADPRNRGRTIARPVTGRVQLPLCSERPAWSGSPVLLLEYPELWNLVGGKAESGSIGKTEGGKPQVPCPNAGTSRPMPWTRGSGDEGAWVNRGEYPCSVRRQRPPEAAAKTAVHERGRPGDVRGRTASWGAPYPMRSGGGKPGPAYPWVSSPGGASASQQPGGGPLGPPPGVEILEGSSAGQREAARESRKSNSASHPNPPPGEPVGGVRRWACGIAHRRAGRPGPNRRGGPPHGPATARSAARAGTPGHLTAGGMAPPTEPGGGPRLRNNTGKSARVSAENQPRAAGTGLRVPAWIKRAGPPVGSPPPPHRVAGPFLCKILHRPGGGPVFVQDLAQTRGSPRSPRPR